MKKLLFIFAIVLIAGYGCNRDEDTATGTDMGIQKEEQRGVNDFTPVEGSDADRMSDEIAPDSPENMDESQSMEDRQDMEDNEMDSMEENRAVE